MSSRTKRATVTFQFPFVLDGHDREFPAGDYEVQTDEELVEGLSFPAYRRVATRLCVRRKPGVTELLPISRASLVTAQLGDEIAAKKDAALDVPNSPSEPPITISLAPSALSNSTRGMQDPLTEAQKDKHMYISPPIVVSAIVVVGLAVTAWLSPPEPVRTDRTVVLPGSTYKQLQSWSKQQTAVSGQPLQVSEFIARLANEWHKANPGAVDTAPAGD